MKTPIRILIGVLVLFTIAINQWVSPILIDKFYYHGIYQGIRSLYSLTIYHLPFAGSYLILPIMLGWVIFFIKKSIASGCRSFAFSFVQLIAIIYVSFMWLWGFNYKLPSIQQRLALSELHVDSTELINEIIKVQVQLQKVRSRIQCDTSPLKKQLDFKELNNLTYDVQCPLLQEMDYRCKNIIKIRKLHPAGSLLIFSTTGIYNPFSMEGHLDPGVFHVNYPFTAAHELAHGFGVTDEGDCNFLALLTCIRSDNDYIRYSGYFSYYRYLMRDLRKIAPYSFYFLGYSTSVGFKNDLKLHYAYLDQFPEIMPTIRDWIYDQYLKANGVNAGLDSYDRVVGLSLAYQKKYGKII